MVDEFKALVVSEYDGKFQREVTGKKIDDLPEGEVLIKVHYSSLNYKDALSATGNKGVTKIYPHTPGIDAAGVVEESSSALHLKGEEVLVTGYGLGMNTSGGFAEYIRVPSGWVVKLPPNLSLKESMILGTAGFTAGLSLYKLELNGLSSKTDEEVIVTGATGGVGSMATAILAKAGYNVAAATGSTDKENYLKQLGAKRIISRDEVDVENIKPLMPGKWAGGIDTAGGNILAAVIAETKMHGSVAACGLVQSNKLNTTLYPFIIRGVNLLGINSAETPMDLRIKIWDKLESEWKPENLDLMCTEVALEELNEQIDLILEGKTTGKIVLNLNR